MFIVYLGESMGVDTVSGTSLSLSSLSAVCPLSCIPSPLSLLYSLSSLFPLSSLCIHSPILAHFLQDGVSGVPYYCYGTVIHKSYVHHGPKLSVQYSVVVAQLLSQIGQ